MHRTSIFWTSAVWALGGFTQDRCPRCEVELCSDRVRCADDCFQRTHRGCSTLSPPDADGGTALGVAAKHVVHIRGLLEQRVRTPRIPDPGGGSRMRVHRNAKTTPKGRALIVQRVEVDGWSVAQTAAAFGVSARTVHKWRARHAAAGLA